MEYFYLHPQGVYEKLQNCSIKFNNPAQVSAVVTNSQFCDGFVPYEVIFHEDL